MGKLDSLQGSGVYSRNVEVTATAEVKPAFRRAAQSDEAKPERTNAYPGRCVDCGGEVPAHGGILGAKVNGRWEIRHKDQCPLPLDSALMKPDKGQGHPGDNEPAPRTTTDEVHPGIYTLETEQGHRTFRVTLQGSDAEFAPGQTILEYLTGRDNDSDYKGFAFIRNGRLNVWKRYRSGGYDGLLADAEEFMRDPEAALEAKHCLRCGRTLSTPESIAAGIGPDCAKRGW